MIDFRNVSFPKEEYDSRIANVRKILEERQIDALICHDISNICYLSGIQTVSYEKYFMMVVPVDGKPVLLSPSFESFNGYINTWFDEIKTYEQTDLCEEDPVAASIRLILNMGLGCKALGFEKNSSCLKVTAYLRFTDSLPDARIIDASGIVESVRIIKSNAEIEYIRQAARLSCKAMKDVVGIVEAGKTDNDLAAAAFKSLAGGGSEYMCIDPIITVGRRSGIPHTTFCRTLINKGDTIFLELGACIHRYTGVIMRTVSVGEPADDVKKMFEGCKRSLNTVIANMGPGADGSEIAARARMCWKNETERWLWHGNYAYSLGLGFPPRWYDCDNTCAIIMEGYKCILEPGMVFHTTCSLRDIGKYGVCLSETVLITKDGHEKLTELPIDLFIK